MTALHGGEANACTGQPLNLESHSQSEFSSGLHSSMDLQPPQDLKNVRFQVSFFICRRCIHCHHCLNCSVVMRQWWFFHLLTVTLKQAQNNCRLPLAVSSSFHVWPRTCLKTLHGCCPTVFMPNMTWVRHRCARSQLVKRHWNLRTGGLGQALNGKLTAGSSSCC